MRKQRKLPALNALLAWDTAPMLIYEDELDRHCSIQLTIFEIPAGSTIIEEINETVREHDWFGKAHWMRQDRHRVIEVQTGSFYYSIQFELPIWGHFKIEIQRPGAEQPALLWYVLKEEAGRPVRFETKGFQVEHENDERAETSGRLTGRPGQSITWERLL